MHPVVPPPETEPSHALPQVHAREAAVLALLGHDLRAALSDVLGGLQLIAPADLAPASRLQVERVRASGELLARLLDQSLSDLLGETATARQDDIFLRRFLTDIDLRWSGRAAEKGLRFHVMLDQDVPPVLRFDRVALDRVLANLIGNAMTYCGHGTVTCHVGCPDPARLRIAVRDDGPGFPPSALDGAPVRQPRPAGSAKPGSGMGLQIAADLTRRLGGRLTLRNGARGGAEAVVDLPLVPGTAAEMPLTHPSDPLLLAGKRVLVADDSLTSQTILTGFVAGLGATVVVAGDGVETLDLLQHDRFDLLIVDIEMPGLTGLDVIRSLRRLPGAIGHVPVIAVTAHPLPANKAAILAAGATAMMVKPLLCQHAFAAVVQAALPLQPAADPSPLPRDPAAFQDARLTQLLQMAGPDVAADLLTRLQCDLRRVEQALIAAAGGPDWIEIGGQSHVLISLAGAVGAVDLQTSAETLNQIARHQDSASLASALVAVLTPLDPLIRHIDQLSLERRLAR